MVETGATIRNVKNVGTSVPVTAPFNFPASPLQNPDGSWREYRPTSLTHNYRVGCYVDARAADNGSDTQYAAIA